MSEPERHRVRVRRSPKIGVFLLIGAVAGALVAIVAVNVTPPDPTIPAPQAIGFLALLLAPVGAAVAGGIALVLDRHAERRSTIVEAERTAPAPPVVVEPTQAAGPLEPDAADSAEQGADPRA